MSVVFNLGGLSGSTKIPTLVPTQQGTLTYSGEPQTPTWSEYNHEAVTILASPQTNAGTYTATATLAKGYVWADTKKADVRNLTWTISEAVIENVPSQSGTLTYNGSEQSPTWLNYDPNKLTISGETSGISYGNYVAKFTPKVNYVWSDGTAVTKDVTWKIKQAPITIPTVSSSGLVYTGQPQSPTISNLNTYYVTVTGDTATNAGNYTVTFALKNKTDYTWTDGTVTNKTASWSIGKATTNVPTVSASGLVYNGQSQSPTISGMDSSLVAVTGNSAVDAGTHTCTFSLKDLTNYTWTDGTSANKTASWSIAKAQGFVNYVDYRKWPLDESSIDWRYYQHQFTKWQTGSTVDLTGEVATNQGYLNIRFYIFGSGYVDYDEVDKNYIAGSGDEQVMSDEDFEPPQPVPMYTNPSGQYVPERTDSSIVKLGVWDDEPAYIYTCYCTDIEVSPSVSYPNNYCEGSFKLKVWAKESTNYTQSDPIYIPITINFKDNG